jgi:uncharacterized protein YcsI (UPF0317 family)
MKELPNTSPNRPTDPRKLRRLIREGKWESPTVGLTPEFVQANLVILPESSAVDFLTFCIRNPKPCPVLDVTPPGDPRPGLLAPEADLRTDVPRYRVYREGQLDQELGDISKLWREDLVAVLIGCSFTFEQALISAEIPMRHWELDCNVAMYATNRSCVPSGGFSGPLVVTMRPIPHELVSRAVRVTSQYHRVHGAPVHIGAPQQLGIDRLDEPDYGDPLPVNEGEVPVFWACGVTPQQAALQSKTPLMITHAPGHMFVSDLRIEELLG